MLSSPRLEIGGAVLKYSKGTWVVGNRLPRIIKGRETEQMIRALYPGGAHLGLSYFFGRADRVVEAGTPDRELLDALLALESGDPLAALSSPRSILRRARGDLSYRALARAAGVSHTTLLRIADGADPRASTLAAILAAAEDAG